MEVKDKNGETVVLKNNVGGWCRYYLIRGGLTNKEIARALHESGIRTGLCIDPDLEQVKAAHRVGARAVELHAGRYGERGPDHEEVLRRIEDAVRLAAKLKLEIGVGHGIDYGNVGKLAENDLIDEFSIGHAIVSRAIYVGMERAVREMKQLVGHA